MLKQCLYIPPGQPIWASTFCVLFFRAGAYLGFFSYIWASSTLPWFSTHQSGQFFFLEDIVFEDHSVALGLLSSRLVLHWILPRFPSNPVSAIMKSMAAFLPIALIISLKIFSSTVLCLLQPRLRLHIFYQLLFVTDPARHFPWHLSSLICFRSST